jgi:hypothetical protein
MTSLCKEMRMAVIADGVCGVEERAPVEGLA